MPSILKIKVLSARELPVMDRTSELTDAYVELRFADFEVQRTRVCRKTLNPIWNEDFRFEVSDDSVLQNEHLEFKVLDYDAITTNDAVGTVYLDLNPIISSNLTQINGWFPIYDTLRGIRGELNLTVKLQFFGEINPLRESALNVRFFSCPTIPASFKMTAVIGLVDYLVTDKDPEFHWSDNFRTPRSSNEARQRLLCDLAGELRKNVAKKILEMGGNAVIGYQLCFDLENEERSITARCIGTACKLTPLQEGSFTNNTASGSQTVGKYSTPISSPKVTSTLKNTINNITDEQLPHSSTSERSGMRSNALQVTDLEERPKRDFISSEMMETAENDEALIVDGEELTHDFNEDEEFDDEKGQRRSSDASSKKGQFQMTRIVRNPELLFLTINQFPPGVILSLGGVVSSHSVKIVSNEDRERDIRDAWWTELRNEIKSHARALGCPYVIGYSEVANIQEDIFLLSATGTAAVLDLSAFSASTGYAVPASTMESHGLPSPAYQKLSLDEVKMNIASSPFGKKPFNHDAQSLDFRVHRKRYLNKIRRRSKGCHIAHIPYSMSQAPLPMSFGKCKICRKRYVPEVLFSTISPPSEVLTIGSGYFLNALVCRPKKRKDGELNAAAIGDAVPFLEYDIHRQLMYKLRVLGYNSIFGLKIQISVGETLLTACASGTAFHLPCLPLPEVIQISRNLQVLDEEDKKLLTLQTEIIEESEKNRKSIEALLESTMKARGEESGVGVIKKESVATNEQAASESDSDDSNKSSSESSGESGDEDFRPRIVVQVDDDADEDVIAVLLEPDLLDGFQLCNVESIPKSWVENKQQQDRVISMQNIVLVKHGIIYSVNHHPNRQLTSIFHDLIYELMYSVLHFQIGLISGMNYEIQLPRENEVRLVLNAVILGLVEKPAPLTIATNSMEALNSGNVATSNLGIRTTRLTSTAMHGALSFSGNNSNMANIDNNNKNNNDEVLNSNEAALQELIGGALEESLTDAASNSAAGPGSKRVSMLVEKAANPLAESGEIGSDVASSIDPEDRKGTMREINSSYKGGNVSSEVVTGNGTINSPQLTPSITSPTLLPHQHVGMGGTEMEADLFNGVKSNHIEITPLSFVPGGRVISHFGHLSLNFVKEDAALVGTNSSLGGGGAPETGGKFSFFMHCFLLEVQAVIRSHVIALGGNVLLSLQIYQSFMHEKLKNQGYGLISVMGDVALVEYPIGDAYEESWYDISRQYCNAGDFRK